MTDEEVLAAHKNDLGRVLDLVVLLQITGSAEKATIAANKVKVAGHVVGMGQRKPIRAQKRHKTLSEMRAFVGFCNYYSICVRMYAEMAALMTALLKRLRR